MAQTLSNIAAILKYDYLPPIKDAFPKKVPLYDEFRKDKESWTGQLVINPVRVNRNTGRGARADGGTLAAAGRQSYVQHQIGAKYNYASVNITGPTIRATKNNAGSFARAITSEIEGASKDLSDDVDMQIPRDGTGTLGVITTGAASATQTLNYAGGGTGSGANGTKYLEVGQTLCIGTAAELGGTGTPAYGTVSSITDRNVVVMTGSITTVTGDLVVQGDSDGNAYNNCIEGMEAGFISTGTYQNVNVANYPRFKPYLSSNSGTNRILTEALMQSVIDNVEEQGGVVDLMLSHISMRPEYLNLLWANKRYADIASMDAGYNAKKEMTFNTIRWKFLRNFPYNRIAFLERDSWVMFEVDGLGWAEEDGSVLHKITRQDAYEADLFYDGNLSCLELSHNGYLKDITASTLSAA